MPIPHTDVMPEAEFDTLTVSRAGGLPPAVDLLQPVDELPEFASEPDLVCRRVRDELMLDGNARLNLATFVTTWMEPQARELMAETAEKNLADRAEYPQITAMEERCVRMLARLWHAPHPEQVRG